MEETNPIIEGLTLMEDAILEDLQPKGTISENLTLDLFNQLDLARKNLMQNG